MAYYTSNTPAVSFGGPATRAVKALLLANIAVFVLQLVGRAAGVNVLEFYFGLIPRRITHEFTVWQFATYMFLHDSHQFFHIFINMFTLYMFGNDLERVWGPKRFLTYYFVTGIGAGFCSYLTGVNSTTVTIGASGAIYGLLLAYGIMYPNRLVYMYLLFPIKVKWLVIIMGALAFFSSITGSEPGVANVAHLGGLLIGFVYLKAGAWLQGWHVYQARRQRDELKREFEVYYGEMRRKIDDEKKKPTIH